MNDLRRDSQIGQYEEPVKKAVSEMTQNHIISRIWKHDHTVWKPEPTEISNRLGWLKIAEEMQQQLGEIDAFAQSAQTAGYTHALLLGMGGSSLAPELFRKTFGVKEDYLELAILDTTDPGAVRSFARQLDPAKTLFIVATKSGETVETLSGFKYFYNQVLAKEGSTKAGEHFIAITDPGSSLIDLGKKYDFRKIFLNDPNIGGRYSALSYFGLVPAALIGVDLGRLLKRSIEMAAACGENAFDADNPAGWLGALMGVLAQAGRNKLTFFASPQVASFGDWAEQLIAESTGKEGKGILPVAGEQAGNPSVYLNDRVFIHLRVADDTSHNKQIADLSGAGHPTVLIEIEDTYDLGGQFFVWELATAVAGHHLAINPFDQPNVEAAKVLARDMVAAYMKSGGLPTENPILTEGNIAVYTKSNISAKTGTEALNQFLKLARPGAYIALHAYVEMTAEADRLFNNLRIKLRDTTRLATTMGYGPRFLHSTGQLHKGDTGLGLFVQFTADDAEDCPIPDEAGTDTSTMTFGILKSAQAMGDGQALRNAGRDVIRFHLGQDWMKELERLINAL